MARGGLADTFRCPSCARVLRDNPGSLGCTGCGEEYPIRDGVVIFAQAQLSSEEHRQREIFSHICRTTFEGFRGHEDYSPRAIQIWKKLRYLRRMACAPGAVVVDVGCAQGFSARLLRARYGAQVIGIDLSESVFVAARQDAILGLNNSYCLAPAERLPLAGQIADFVICFDLLEHLPKPEEALAEFVRILRPGGWLLIHMPVRDDAYTFQWFLTRCFPRWTTAQLEAIGHFYDQIITSHRLLEIVQALPLRVLKAEKFGGWFQPLHDWFLLALLGKASDVVKGLIGDPATSRPDPSALSTSAPSPRDKKGISELLKRIHLAALWTFRNLSMIGYVLVDLPLSRLGIGYTVYLLAERIGEHRVR